MRFNPLPEFPELQNSIVAPIARDQTGIDRADRSPDNPVRLDIRFMQSLIDARLVRSKRATTLKHQLTYIPTDGPDEDLCSGSLTISCNSWRNTHGSKGTDCGGPQAGPPLSANGPAPTNEDGRDLPCSPMDEGKGIIPSSHPLMPSSPVVSLLS